MALNDLKLTFRDEFNSLSLDTGTPGTASKFWNTTMYNGTVRSLYDNGEKQWYVDPDHNGSSKSKLGINPFSVKDGVLSIKARPSGAAKSSLFGYDYTSGVLTSQGEFSQKYGYFEMRAKVPEGQGLWPAFWLLADHGGWPPEIDVMEILGHDTKTLHQTTHTTTNDGRGEATYSPVKLSDGYHTYGVDWTKEKITFYLDGKETWSRATPADMHTPMYMLMNLAVGGYWPGSPDGSTKFNAADYKIDYVRAYQHTGQAGSGSPLPAGSGAASPSPGQSAAQGQKQEQASTSSPAPSPNGKTSIADALNLTPSTETPTPNPWGISHVTLSNGVDASGVASKRFKPLETEAGTTTYTKEQMGIAGVADGTTVDVTYDKDKNLTVVNNGAWNDIKYAWLSSSDIQEMTVNNFVGVDIDMTGNQNGVINVTDAKWGTINTGSGKDTIHVTGKTNTTGDHALSIRSGAGNDKITYAGNSNNWTAITAGDGADEITVKSGGSQIAGGNGDDHFAIDTADAVILSGDAGNDVFSIVADAHATISDFKAGADRIELKGVSADDVRVRASGNSTLIDLNGNTAATLAGVALSSGQLNLSYA